MHAGDADSQEAAALFYFLNRTGYNGLCRFNSRGEFNVPFGRYKSIRYLTSFPAFCDAAAAWEFTTGDVAAVPLATADFVYADPPYDVEFTAYARGGFSWDDQVRTAELLAEHRGPVVLMNQATPRIDALYRRLRYAVRYLDAPRRISSDGDRTPAREIVATRHV
jgi:DNA adenine methylase